MFNQSFLCRFDEKYRNATAPFVLFSVNYGNNTLFQPSSDVALVVYKHTLSFIYTLWFQLLRLRRAYHFVMDTLMRAF